MSDRPQPTAAYCIFDYLYCDAGNWSTGELLLLAGEATEDAYRTIKTALEWPDVFVAEQVGIPSLCAQHFESCGSYGPSELDHAYHTFCELRPATAQEVESLTVFGHLETLVETFISTQGRWDVRLSPNVS